MTNNFSPFMVNFKDHDAALGDGTKHTKHAFPHANQLNS
jgi:hypothetical protein